MNIGHDKNICISVLSMNTQYMGDIRSYFDLIESDDIRYFVVNAQFHYCCF